MTDSGQLTIREALLEEISSIVELDEQSSGSAHWTPQEYTRIIGSKSTHVVLVAESEDRSVVGFLVGRKIAEEWDLENIVVAVERQKQGIAYGLLSAFIRAAERERAKSIFLEVRSSNTAAIALYHKAGFQQDAVRKSYYSDPVDDALLFSLSLKNSS